MEVVVFGAGVTSFNGVFFDAKHGYTGGIPTAVSCVGPDKVTDLEALLDTLRQQRVRERATARAALRKAIAGCGANRVILTRGAATLIESIQALAGIPGKTIVVTTTNFLARSEDAAVSRDLGIALSVVQVLPPGVYQVVEGKVLPAGWGLGR